MAKKQQLKDSEYHLSPTDIKKAINAAKTFRDRCIIKTFAQAAVRRFELANLDVRDLDLERRIVHIQEGKGEKARTIPISEDLLEDLRHLLASRRTRYPISKRVGAGWRRLRGGMVSVCAPIRMASSELWVTCIGNSP